VIRGGADATDGLKISSSMLGPTLPHGVMIAMNSKPQNFLLFRWQDIAAPVQPGLRLNGQD
jgi:myo-inositol-hexaphosphate 3-phosphohydrolase